MSTETVSTEITTKASILAAEADLIAKPSWPAITDQAGYELAAAARKDAKAKLADLEAEKEEMYRPVKKGLDKITAFFKPHIDGLKGFIVAVDKPMVAYVQAEQRKADAIKRELEEAARKKAEEDRKALAEMMEDTGQTELAIAVLAAPVVVEEVIVAPVAIAAGTSTRKGFDVSVTDKMALLAAIVSGEVDHRCVEVVMSEVRRWVSVHGAAPAGVTVSEKIIMVNR